MRIEHRLSSQESDRPAAAELEIGVGGMTCAACSARVERALGKVPGVLSAAVNLATARASLRYLPASTAPEDIARAIAEAGYEPRLLEEEEGEAAEARARERVLADMWRDTVAAAALTLPLVALSFGAMFFPALDNTLKEL
ncbi:MAG: cation transporter, partial [Thermodesulfobacteriota bacterium]